MQAPMGQIERSRFRERTTTGPSVVSWPRPSNRNRGTANQRLEATPGERSRCRLPSLARRASAGPLAEKMKLISKSAFLRQFGPQGVALDRRYSPPQTLMFERTSELRWSCDMPARIKDGARWITALVDAAHPGQKTFLYPRDGAWKSGDSVKLFQTAAIFSFYGLKPTGDEVVQAEEAERDAVESLFFLSLMFGGTVSDDIFLIPDHAMVILYADHHEAVHADFADGEFMNRYVSEIPEFA
jgi:hypothetical protein